MKKWLILLLLLASRCWATLPVVGNLSVEDSLKVDSLFSRTGSVVYIQGWAAGSGDITSVVAGDGLGGGGDIGDVTLNILTLWGLNISSDTLRIDTAEVATQADISESVLEGFLDIADLQGNITDAKVPDDISIDTTNANDTQWDQYIEQHQTTVGDYLDPPDSTGMAYRAWVTGLFSPYIDSARTKTLISDSVATHDNFSELGGTASDAQVPNDITIDTTNATDAQWEQYIRDHQTAGGGDGQNADSIMSYDIDTTGLANGEYLQWNEAGSKWVTATPAGSGDIEGVTAGDGLYGGGESGTVTLHVNPETDKGLQITSDSLGIKLDGSTLALSASGIKVSTVSGVTGANEDDVSLTDVQTATTSDFHNIGGTDDDTPDAGDYSNLTAGDALVNNPTGTIFVNVETDKGLVITSDSLGIKLDGSTLALSSSGVKVDNVTGVTGADADNVSLTDVQTATTSDFHNIGGTDDDTPDAGDYSNLTGGDGIANNPTGTIAANLDFDGGLETTDDSINVKLDGTTLAKSATGLKVNAITSTEISTDQVSSDEIAAMTSSNWASEVSDETGSGKWVFATDPVFLTSINIPNAANPTVDAAGEVAWDSDDMNLRVYATQARAINTVQICDKTFFDPDNLQPTEDAFPILNIHADWAPFGITILSCGIKTDASSSYTVVFEEWSAPDTWTSDIESVATSSTLEAEDDGTLSDASIAVGSIVFVDLPTTAVNFLEVWFTYYVNSGD